MAVSTTFKQKCPTCDAMVTVKETQVGKKVECHKCKDKFVAEAPAQKKASPKKDKESAKKKADTRVSSKASPPGKNGKKAPVVEEVDDFEIVEEEEDLEIDEIEEEDEKPQTKSKAKPAVNGKTGVKAKAPPPGKSKKVVDEEEDEEEETVDDEDVDEDEKPKKGKKKEGGGNKMTLGLALAGLGVVILCVAAYFVLGSRGGGGGGGRKGGPIVAQQPIEDNLPPVPKQIATAPVEPAIAPLSDTEIAKLSNLLPGDAEHVAHIGFKELLVSSSPLREAAFQTPGSLVDADLKKRLGFSPLAIDDMMRAERYSTPWTFTVVHFKDVLKERDIVEALDLKQIGAPIEGLAYYKSEQPNPWFNQLARLTFGIPSQVAMFQGLASDRPAFVHFYNAQTMIVGDETPMIAFLKAKGQFPMLTPRGGGGQPQPKAGASLRPMPHGASKVQFIGYIEEQDAGQAQPNGGDFKIEGVLFTGKENNDGAIRFKFTDASNVIVVSSKNNLKDAAGQWTLKGTNGAEIMIPSVAGLSYDVTVDTAGKMTGMGKDAQGGMWPVELTPGGAPDTTPKAPAGIMRDDMYLTVKPTLKAILDRMEGRAASEKVLYSSATDMDASRVLSNLPDFRDRIVRRPRQFWDITLMVPEAQPRIRMLGVSLIQRDGIKYQFRNEMTCGQEIDAKHIHRELNDRSASQVARFVLKLTGHEIRLPQQEKPVAPPMVGTEQPPATQPEQKKPTEATSSQITLSQESNTVQFTLDLVLDNSALTQIHGITALAASALRVEMEAAAALSLRHLLAVAGKTLGEKGLSEREVAPGRFPPAAFKRVDAPLRPDREPKNRISWMAGLLPYLGNEGLYRKIQFDQSWREPPNWMAGRSVVPQFLDPMYPDSARFAAFADLPVDFGATHYVGIAGVGLDAAAYNRRDPAVAHRLGVLGYDGSAALEEVAQGRGTSNAILMIQVPHDGVTGVSPWIAGGGATVRGVPEKNSIAPFVLSTDRAGKIIQHQKKRGTFALMSDGSVRFIDQNISDPAFQAMCTIGGPAPKDFDTDLANNAPLVPAPGAKSAPVARPPEKKPAALKDEKKPADVQPKKTEPAPATKDEEKKTSFLDGFPVQDRLERRAAFEADRGVRA